MGIQRLVMFGSQHHRNIIHLKLKHKMSATAAAAWLLRHACNYATFLGFIWFGIKSNHNHDDSLVAQNRYCYKWFCLLSRLLISGYFAYRSMALISVISNPQMIVLLWIRLAGFLTCTGVIMLMQFWYGQRIVRIVNDFLRLFRRVRALPGCQFMQFGGRRELGLLIFKTMCLLYELACEFPMLFNKLDVSYILTVLCDMYITINAMMIGHACFVGFLSVGALYAQVNRYVRHELRRQLRGLEQPNGQCASRRELKAAGYRLDECLAIYNEIQRVSSSFQELIELPLSLILLFLFLSMTLVSYFVMLNRFRDYSIMMLVVKLFMDLVLLTLAIHGASSSSRVIKRLSLENCYVTERKDWHVRLEIFLNRLNFFEFRVNPLGLFEISNELILVFLSGLVTYLTYILQYGIQSNQIALNMNSNHI
ncbi:putative gustatory receptor 93c [Drosophila albomicans]|uniref:Gustatory receptor n=1 Tax=Drosophila albomicans TaxID=7291 RepID=A0A6P8XQC8_DROAB|nr:putative gustatory receptor 93c [Drosophila albomicans]